MIRFKHRPNDFKVSEIYDRSRIGDKGPFAVFELIKVKLSTLEVASMLARAARVTPAEVSFAGLKDRQGKTKQLVSVRTTRRFQVDEGDIDLRWLGRSDSPVDSSWNLANRFQIVVRGLQDRDLRRMERNLEEIEATGLPNYFDDQRFGCLRHGQGLILRRLLTGREEEALRRLVASSSRFESEEDGQAKAMIRNKWGDWNSCRHAARRLGRYLGVFEHLQRHPEDFLGAFQRVAHRERLIHLYAYQSFLWNRLTAEWIERSDSADLLYVETDMGSLPMWARPRPDIAEGLERLSMPLLDPKYRPPDEKMKRAIGNLMREEGLRLSDLDGPHVAGLRFKYEERAVQLRPSKLVVGRPFRDETEDRAVRLELSFELPRGCYATMVLKRLFLANKRGKLGARSGGAERRVPNVKWSGRDGGADVRSNRRPIGRVSRPRRGEGK